MKLSPTESGIPALDSSQRQPALAHALSDRIAVARLVMLAESGNLELPQRLIWMPLSRA
jgi:hypothetical protein